MLTVSAMGNDLIQWHLQASLVELILLTCVRTCVQGRSKRVDRVDNVQDPRGSRGPPIKINPQKFHWLGGPSLFLIHGSLRVLLRPCMRACVRACVCVRTYISVLLYSLRLTQAIQLNLAVIIVPTPVACGIFVEVDTVFPVGVVRFPRDPCFVAQRVFTVHPEPRAFVKYVGPAQPHTPHVSYIKAFTK